MKESNEDLAKEKRRIRGFTDEQWAEKLKQDLDLATSKKRRLTVTLTDNQLAEIQAFAYRHEITVDDILSNYIADLTSMYDNGSDEREYAARYFQKTHLAHVKEYREEVSYILSE